MYGLITLEELNINNFMLNVQLYVRKVQLHNSLDDFSV